MPSVCLCVCVLYSQQADTDASRAECYVEKGMMYQKMRDYRYEVVLTEGWTRSPPLHGRCSRLQLCASRFS